jgi:hypothetical protein
MTFQELAGFVYICKHFSNALSHEAVLRSFRNPDVVKDLLPVVMCLPYSSIYVPSPIRLLRILKKSKCENCLGSLAEDQKWIGLFLCSTCQHNLSAPIPLDLYAKTKVGDALT